MNTLVSFDVIRALRLAPKAHIKAHTRAEEEVIFIHKGSLTVNVDEDTITLQKGDNFTTPIGCIRQFTNIAVEDCIAYITRRGNMPAAPVHL